MSSEGDVGRGKMARPTGFERADAINIRIPIEGADYGLMAEGAQPGARTRASSIDSSSESMPMLACQHMDMVAFGPSPHDDASYYLIRAFGSLQDRQREDDAFYGSEKGGRARARRSWVRSRA